MSILLLIVWNIYEKRPLLYSFRDLNSIIITIEDNMPHAAHAVMLSEGDSGWSERSMTSVSHVGQLS